MHGHSAAFFHAVAHTPDHRQRFCLWHAPQQPAAAVVIYAHPFAEEMNKARRMAALQSQALVGAGCAVLQLDLLGCGDSAGDFGDATWDAWVDDIVAACATAHDRHAQAWPEAPRPKLWLWGLRAGCLLASAAAARMAEPCNFLFWQPSASGKPVLQQFLRLKVAASLGQADTRAVSEQLRVDMAAQRVVDVAGYRLAPPLATGLGQAQLDPPAAFARVIWIEITSRAEAELLPVSRSIIARWQAAGHTVEEHVVAGPSFWSTVEIEDAPQLVAVSTQRLVAALA